MPAYMTTLALQPRQNDGSAKSQYNSGYWRKAGVTEHADHATERREAPV